MQKLNEQDEQDKRDSLMAILREFSASQDMLKDFKRRQKYFLRLESIYYNVDSDNFRHYYSDIYATLTLINNEGREGLEVLGQNMQAILKYYKAERKDAKGNIIDIKKEITKLYDHVNLEISRINYSNTIVSQTESELAKVNELISSASEDVKKKAEVSIEEKIKEVSASIKEASDQVKEDVETSMKEELKTAQTEYITILGIFAAIVVTFTGGLAFSSSVLQNIGNTSIYRLLAIVLVLGLVVFNVIYYLIHFLMVINKKVEKGNIYFAIVVNSVLILGLVVTFLSYKWHWMDRDMETKSRASTVEVTQTDSSLTATSLPEIAMEESNKDE